MKLKGIIIAATTGLLAGCTTAPYASVGLTYKATIETLEEAGKEPLGRLRTRVRMAYFQQNEWLVSQGQLPSKLEITALLCQPQRPYSRAITTLGLQRRAAAGIEEIAKPTPQELGAAIGTLGANYSLVLPREKKGEERSSAYGMCADDVIATEANFAGSFLGDGSVRESLSAVGLTEVITQLTPAVLSFITFIDQHRRADALQTYFGSCADDDTSGDCGNADKLKAAIESYGKTLDALNRYERAQAAMLARKALKAASEAQGEKRDEALKVFLEVAETYDAALDRNILPYSTKVAEALVRLRKIADGEPDPHDLPSVIESFVVASQAFLAAAVAEEQIMKDPEARKKLHDSWDKFLGRKPKKKDDKKPEA